MARNERSPVPRGRFTHCSRMPRGRGSVEGGMLRRGQRRPDAGNGGRGWCESCSSSAPRVRTERGGPTWVPAQADRQVERARPEMRAPVFH